MNEKNISAKAFQFVFVNINAQKSAGVFKDSHELTKILMRLNETYANNQHELGGEKLADDAEVYFVGWQNSKRSF